jgi:hypothetical protein
VRNGSLALGAALLLFLEGACRQDETAGARIVAPAAAIRLSHGESVVVKLEWTPLAPLSRAGMHPTVFVHLIDRPNHVLRTFDHELPGPWTVGTAQRDEFDLYQSALGAPLPAGHYTLTAGLYDPALGYRWPLAAAGPDVTGHREYRVVDVEVPSGRSAAVPFDFSGEWSAVEPGSDKQVLQRRWLTGSGAITIGPSDMPRPIRAEVRVMGTGARLRSTCDASAGDLPTGARWIEASPAAGRPCEVRFEPKDGAPQPRWLAVEVLALRAR